MKRAAEINAKLNALLPALAERMRKDSGECVRLLAELEKIKAQLGPGAG